VSDTKLFATLQLSRTANMTLKSAFPRSSAFGLNCLVVCAVVVLAYFLSTRAAAAPGQLDHTFGGGAGIIELDEPLSPGFGHPVRLLGTASGRLVLAGGCSRTENGTTTFRFCMMQTLPDGTLDDSFGAQGLAVAPPITGTLDILNAAAIGPDGSILVAGYCGDYINGTSPTRFCAARFTDQGILDTSFGVNGTKIYPISQRNDMAQSALVLADGRALIAGTCDGDPPVGSGRSICLIRIDANGDLDSTFGAGGAATVEILSSLAGVGLQSDGRVVVGGLCWSGVPHFCVARFSASGALDTSFGAGQGVVVWKRTRYSDVPLSFSLRADDSILLAGTCDFEPTNPNNWSDVCVARFTADGLIDESFGALGVGLSGYSRTDAADRMVVQSDGRIVMVGSCSLIGDCLIRFSDLGAPDMSYGANGVVRAEIGTGYLGAALGQADGKVLVAVHCTYPNTYGKLCFARLKGGPYSASSCAINVDANQTVDPATDGTLIARYLLGFRGEQLTAGALGQNPTRIGPALESYLGTLNLDADGDGQSLAFTDGLLILRAMLGLTGTALTSGATNATHPNTRLAQEILTWIESVHGVACLP